MALTQSHYRFGIVELLESTHGWLAAEDQPINLPAGVPFLLRFCVQATGGVAESNVALQFQYNRNGLGWVDITTTSAVARTGSTTVFTNGQNCTKRLSGTGTFETTAAGCTHDGSSGGAANDIVANGNSETEIGVQILAADTEMGDVIEFRLTRDGGILLDAYAVIPAITVAAEIFPVADRQPGVATSGPRTIPSGQAGKTFLVLTSIPQADLDDPAVAFALEMEVQNPDLTWRFDAGCTFVGGANQGKGGTPTRPPGFTVTVDAGLAGKDVRFRLNNTGVAFDAGLIAVPI